MIGPGIPETVNEAEDIIGRAAAVTPGVGALPHWPHSQIVALCQTVERLQRRVEELEARPRRGRPPKAAADATADLVDRVTETLQA